MSSLRSRARTKSRRACSKLPRASSTYPRLTQASTNRGLYSSATERLASAAARSPAWTARTPAALSAMAFGGSGTDEVHPAPLTSAIASAAHAVHWTHPFTPPCRTRARSGCVYAPADLCERDVARYRVGRGSEGLLLGLDVQRASRERRPVQLREHPRRRRVGRACRAARAVRLRVPRGAVPGRRSNALRRLPRATQLGRVERRRLGRLQPAGPWRVSVATRRRAAVRERPAMPIVRVRHRRDRPRALGDRRRRGLTPAKMAGSVERSLRLRQPLVTKTELRRDDVDR